VIFSRRHGTAGAERFFYVETTATRLDGDEDGPPPLRNTWSTMTGSQEAESKDDDDGK
jgi:hypothetical protein